MLHFLVRIIDKLPVLTDEEEEDEKERPSLFDIASDKEEASALEGEMAREKYQLLQELESVKIASNLPGLAALQVRDKKRQQRIMIIFQTKIPRLHPMNDSNHKQSFLCFSSRTFECFQMA